MALSLALLGGCSPPTTAEFSPPKQFTKDQRPTRWDAPRNERLGIQDMGPAKGQAEKVWVGDTPAGFEAQPAQPARFRDAVWKVVGEADTDIYLTAGVGGGVAGNLRRWYLEQFGIQEVPTMESLPVVEIAGRPGRLAELKGTFSGKPGWAALIAFAADGDRVTSFKFTGPESVVMGNRDKFLALAKSLRSATASPDAKAPPIDAGQAMPDSHPPTGATPPSPHGSTPPAASAAPAAAGFTATAPAGWAPKAGTSRMLHHTFGSDGEVYLSQLGGSLKPTLDIWRGEMGLPPMADAEFAALPKMAFLGEDALLLEVAGDFRSMSGKQIPAARMLVAARLDGSTITFAKLVGPAADVAAHADAFRLFCGSVRRAQ